MTYYNECGKILDTSDYKNVIHDSRRSQVLLNEDKILKRYKKDEYKYNKLSTRVFNIIKDIKSPNFIEIYDIYYKNYLKYLKSRISADVLIDGYIAKYYEQTDEFFYNLDVLYVLDNLHRLEKLVEILTKEGIALNDVNKRNTIVTSDDIVIIDPDKFSFYSCNDYVRMHNKKVLLKLFQDLLSSYYGSVPIFKIWDLFDLELANEDDMAYQLNKKLVDCKKVGDFFRK